jgi:hypothetical protein
VLEDGPGREAAGALFTNRLSACFRVQKLPTEGSSFQRKRADVPAAHATQGSSYADH